MCVGDFELLEDGDDVGGIALASIGLRLVRFIARTVSTRIDQDQAMSRLQGFDIAEVIPGLEAVGEAVLEHQRRAITLNLVMNADALIVGVRHCPPS